MEPPCPEAVTLNTRGWRWWGWSSTSLGNRLHALLVWFLKALVVHLVTQDGGLDEASSSFLIFSSSLLMSRSKHLPVTIEQILTLWDQEGLRFGFPKQHLLPETTREIAVETVVIWHKVASCIKKNSEKNSLEYQSRSKLDLLILSVWGVLKKQISATYVHKAESIMIKSLSWFNQNMHLALNWVYLFLQVISRLFSCQNLLRSCNNYQC